MKRTDHGHAQHWKQGKGWVCDDDCPKCSEETLYGDPPIKKSGVRHEG